MPTFEETQDLLDEMVNSLPPGIFEGLNGGIHLSPDVFVDDDNYFVMGHYHFEPHGLGRYITVYYGSLMEFYGRGTRRRFIKELEGVLHHELTHHLENLAGDRSLEIQDELDREK